eukprot:5536515-Pyramimonas_sp.AAC.1
MNTSRRDLPEQHELDLMQIRTHQLTESSTIKAIISGAQRVWTELYGIPRASHARLKGWKRTHREAELQSVPDFVAKRRKRVHELMAESGNKLSRADVHSAAMSGCGPAWTAKHTKEDARQQGLRHVRFLEAGHQGLLVDPWASPFSGFLCRPIG